MYARLHLLLTDEHLAGESIYNAVLGQVADELKAKGVAVVDDGALCVFVPGFNAPLILRKRDGGYGYDVTDLAALRHRVRDLHADRLIYVVDVRQGDHFAQVFAVSRMAGWLPDSVSAQHVGYGMVLGNDGKPYKTRDGKAMHLSTLLDMAEEIAAPPIALAAIKYADLSNGLNKDYVFDVERMVPTTGQHRSLPAVRARPDDPGARPGRGRGRAARAARSSPCSTSRRAGPGAAAVRLRRGRRRGRRRPSSRTGSAPTSTTSRARSRSSTSAAPCCARRARCAAPGSRSAPRRSGSSPPGSTCSASRPSTGCRAAC